MHGGVIEMLAWRHYHGTSGFEAIFWLIVIALWIIFKAISSATQTNRDWSQRRQFGVYRQEAAPNIYQRQHGGQMLDAIRAVFRRTARCIGGEYSQIGPWGMPRIVFKHKDGQGLLMLVQPGSDPSFQRLQLTFVRPKGFDARVEAVRQTISDDVIRARGVQDIQLGDPSFDPRFIIKGDRELDVREFFSPDVKAAMERIRALGADDNVVLSMNRQRLRVEKAPPLQHLDHIMELVSAAKELYDRAVTLDDGSAGVAVMESVRGEEVVCQVCGAEIKGDPATCARCATPHHKDCWEFNKKCSTFGCGETKYV